MIPHLPIELPLTTEETLTLIPRRAWLDIACRAGQWFASLRLHRPGEGEGTNGYTDSWRGPYPTRPSAMANAYAFGRHSAAQHGLRAAATMPRSIWAYLTHHEPRPWLAPTAAYLR